MDDVRVRRAVIEHFRTDTPDTWRDALLAFGGACAYCGKAGVPLERDHMVPVKGGGVSIPMNLVPACHECNQEKGTRSAEEFCRAKGYDYALFQLKWLTMMRRLKAGPNRGVI